MKWYNSIDKNNSYQVKLHWDGPGWYAGTQTFECFEVSRYSDPETIPAHLSNAQWLEHPIEAWNGRGELISKNKEN